MSQVKRLDSHRINLHFREHKAEGTFLKQSCRKTLSSGDEVIGVYILPKYKLCYAMDKPNQMQAMLQLSLATTFEEIIIVFSKQCVLLAMVLSKTNHYRNWFYAWGFMFTCCCTFYATYVFQWLRIDNGIICLVFFGKGTHFIPLRHIQPVLFISKQMINFFVIYFYFFLCFLLLYVSSTRTQSFHEHIHITGRFISGTNTKKNKSKSRRGRYKD